jgi:pyruvate dehydrogenase E2 component (dihydrolipoamide acetyltransferase)
MESGTIVRWLKSEGDAVEKGEPLYEVDTDKATQEVEAEASGVLLEIAVESGEVPVGKVVALIGEPGEKPAPEPAASAPDDGDGSGAPSGTGEVASAPAVSRGEEKSFRAAVNGAREVSSGRAKASPLARRMAHERDIDLGTLSGTGPDGRIVAEDIERAEAARSAAPVAASSEQAPTPAAAASSQEQPAEQPSTSEPALSVPAAEPVAATPVAAAPRAAAASPEPGEVETIPLTNIRKTIARRLTQAWTVPVFQLTVSVDMTHANELIERSRELNPEVRVTVTDLLAKVCARALMRHPEVNVQYTEEALLRFPTANIGLAVAAPQGLVVPVVKSAERLPLDEVATRRGELVARAREGALQLPDLEGGTFTISNLGMFGIEQFSAVLNPPQAAILAVGATADRPVAQDGQVVVLPMMTVTLTVDHRAVDGAPAAEFLRTVKTFLEDPALAL